MKLSKMKMISLLLAILLLIPAIPNNTFALGAVSGVVSESYYYIKNQRSGLYLDNYGNDMIQRTFHGGETQQFKLEYITGTGYYVIRSRAYPDFVMDVYDSQNANGTPIILYPFHDGDNQLWEIVKNTDGTYRLLSKCSNRTSGAVVESSSTAEGAKVVHFQYGNYQNRNWYIEPVGGVSAAAKYSSSLYAGDEGIDTWNGGLFSAPKEQDAIDFSKIMTNAFGYKNDVLDVRAKKIRILGRQPNGVGATWLYWSGHSLGGKMSYYDNSGGYVSYTDGFNGAEYVGTSIVGNNSINGYYSNTAWNGAMRWAIIAACNQLSEPYYNGWAKTLLGYDDRAHSVWGYAQAAPTGPIDTQVINAFNYYCQQRFSIMNAWGTANYDYGQPLWAGVTHYSAINDGVHPWGVIYTAGHRSQYPDIRYVKSGQIGSISLSSTSVPQKAYIYSVNDANTLSEKKGTVTNQSEIMGTLKKADENAIFSDRRIRVLNNSFDVDKQLSLSPNAAVQMAKKYAIQNELLDSEMLDKMDYKIYAIMEQSVDVLDDMQVKEIPNTFAYAVVFRRVLDGIPFAPEFGNSYKAIIDGNGVCWSSVNWEDISIKNEVLIIEDGLVNSTLNKLKLGNVIDKELVYVPSDLDGSKSTFDVIPVWKISASEGTIYMNAATGELLNNLNAEGAKELNLPQDVQIFAPAPEFSPIPSPSSVSVLTPSPTPSPDNLSEGAQSE